MACGKCTSKTSKTTYVWTGTDGTTKAYSSEVEAKAQKARKGGDYKRQ